MTLSEFTFWTRTGSPGPRVGQGAAWHPHLQPGQVRDQGHVLAAPDYRGSLPALPGQWLSRLDGSCQVLIAGNFVADYLYK